MMKAIGFEKHFMLVSHYAMSVLCNCGKTVALTNAAGAGEPAPHQSFCFGATASDSCLITKGVEF